MKASFRILWWILRLLGQVKVVFYSVYGKARQTSAGFENHYRSNSYTAFGISAGISIR